MSLESKFVRKFSQSCERIARWMPDKYVVLMKPNNSGCILRRRFSDLSIGSSTLSGEGVLESTEVEEMFSIEIQVSADPNTGEYQVMCSQDDVDAILADLGFEYQVEKVVSDPKGIRRRPTWRTTYWTTKEGPKNDWVNTVDVAAPMKIIAALWTLIEVVSYESKRRVIEPGLRMLGAN